QTVLLRPLPADSPALSDLLLLRSADALPDSLAAAVEGARGTDRVHRGEPLGIYWEVYGLAGDAPNLLTLSVRLVNRHRGWMRRLAERIGIVHTDEPIRLKWQEPTGGGSYLPRSLFIEIPSDLDPGTYDVEISAELIGHEPLVATRQIEVVE
ncbi:MAG TPA: hypothetical protein VFI96_07760, partial [Longimicrobiaceae bacterium]|nr:hypothetical protein [Longimicrobiaceae bacterium]